MVQLQATFNLTSLLTESLETNSVCNFATEMLHLRHVCKSWKVVHIFKSFSQLNAFV